MVDKYERLKNPVLTEEERKMKPKGETLFLIKTEDGSHICFPLSCYGEYIKSIKKKDKI